MACQKKRGWLPSIAFLSQTCQPTITCFSVLYLLPISFREKAGTQLLGPTVYGSARIDLSRLDYILIATDSTDDHYVAMPCVGTFIYCWHFSTANIIAANAALAKIGRCVAMGVLRQLMSSALTHFENEASHFVQKILRVPHHLTLSHTSRRCHAVEGLGNRLLQFFRPVSGQLSGLTAGCTKRL